MQRANRNKDEQRMAHIRLDPELHRRLRIVVASKDTSLQDWLANIVKNAVDEEWPTINGEGKK